MSTFRAPRCSTAPRRAGRFLRSTRCASRSTTPPIARSSRRTRTRIAPVRPQRRAALGDPQSQRAATAGRRRQRVLPGQVRGHLSGLDVRDIGAQQTGMTRKHSEKLLAAANCQGKQHGSNRRCHPPPTSPRSARPSPTSGIAYWKPFFDGFKPVHKWLSEVKPDVAVIPYNDHGPNFNPDRCPPSRSARRRIHQRRRRLGHPHRAGFKGDRTCPGT